MKKTTPILALLLGALAGCSSDGGASRATSFERRPAITISGPSPFAECTVDVTSESPFVPNSEVEPWLAISPTNRNHMAATWQQDRYDQSGGCRGNVVAVSFDGGATWESSTLPSFSVCTDGSWQRASDPWVTFAANGELYSVSLGITPASDTTAKVSGIVVHRSPDGGRTWTDPITISQTDVGFGDDKQSMTADVEDPCTLYVSWSRFERVGAEGDVLFSRTTDCGANWSEPSLIERSNPHGLQVQLAQLPSTELVAVFVENSPFPAESPLWVMRSSDRGETWTDEPIIAATQSTELPRVPDTESQRVRSGVLDIAVDRRNGTLYLVWEQYTDGATPIGVALSASTDGGQSWSAPARIDKTPPAESVEREQAFLPSIEVSDDGTVAVTYYNFENDTPSDERADADAWFIHCHPEDGDCATAEAWSEPIRLTAASFDYTRAPLTRAGDVFLGDYLGLASAGRDFFAVLAVTTQDDPADAVLVPVVGR